MDLKQRTEKALIWSFVDKFGQQIIYFVSGIILANLLMPGDYGKIGVLTIFIVLFVKSIFAFAFSTLNGNFL